METSGRSSYSKFQLMKIGSFGKIYRAWNLKSKCHVAIKEVSASPSQSRNGHGPLPENEIAILSSLDCENVITLVEFWSEPEKLLMAFEWMEYDLRDLLVHFRSSFLKKRSMVMLLRAVGCLHNNGIMHRDINPDNILVNSKGILKLADFGLARKVGASEPQKSETTGYSSCAGTRSYRAPEMLFGSTSYNQQVDLWSTGCVCAEIHSHKVLLSSDTDIGQLGLIISIFGHPLQNNWDSVIELPDYGKIDFLEPENPPGLRKLLPKANPEFIDFVQLFLVLDPDKRQNAETGLNHEYLVNIPDELHLMEAIKSKEKVTINH